MTDAELGVLPARSAAPARRRGALPRPFAEPGAHAERALRWRARPAGTAVPAVWPGTSLPACGRLRGRRRCSTPRSRSAASRQPPALAWSLLRPPHASRPPATSRRRSRRPRRASSCPHGSTTRFAGHVGGLALGLALLAAASRARGRACWRPLRRRTAPVPGDLARVLLELLTRSWLALGRREEAAARPPRRRRCADAARPAAARAWRRACRGRGRARRAATRARPRRGARRRRPPTALGARSRRRRRARSPGRALGAAGEQRAGGRGAQRAAATSTPAARRATAPTPSASCAGSARRPHRRTRPGSADGTASRRSPSASCRSRG